MRRAVWLLLVTACWTEAPLPPPVVIPRPPITARRRPAVEPYESLVGAWTGHGFQYNNSDDWDIELVFSRQASIGDTIGTVEYPGLACGGVLLRRPEHADGTLVVQEKITHGTNCVDGGTFQFPSHPETGMEWKWFMPDTGEEGASGAVHRKR